MSPVNFRIQEPLRDAQLLLNAVGGALAGYSTRKLRSAYSGYALRVRESDGDTEADIGFDGGDLDVAALLSHCGSNSGYVTKWYDQGINGYYLEQTADEDQPCVVDAGSVVYGLNSRVAVDFDDNKLVSVYDGAVHRPNWEVPNTSFALLSPDTLDSAGALDDYIMSRMISSNNGGLVMGIERAASEFRAWIFGAGAPFPSANVAGSTGWRLLAMQAESGAKSKIAENDDSWTESGDTITGWAKVDGYTFALGARSDQTTPGYRLDGKIHEVILYPSVLSAGDVAKCKNNINACYGVW